MFVRYIIFITTDEGSCMSYMFTETFDKIIITTTIILRVCSAIGFFCLH